VVSCGVVWCRVVSCRVVSCGVVWRRVCVTCSFTFECFMKATPSGQTPHAASFPMPSHRVISNQTLGLFDCPAAKVVVFVTDDTIGLCVDYPTDRTLARPTGS
jgi:hypothetical protein